MTTSLDAWRASLNPAAPFSALRPKARPPVSRVLLVGGGTRVAGFDAFVAHCVGIPVDAAAVDRDGAVALGAALQAAALDGDPAFADDMVLDVLHASLARAVAEAALGKKKRGKAGDRAARRRGAAPPEA